MRPRLRLALCVSMLAAIGPALADPPTCGSNHIPANHEDVAATDGQWAVLTLSTGTLARGRSWNAWDGGPIPGLIADACMLLTLRSGPPDYDGRLQTVACAETVDAPANELRIDCTTPLRPAGELRGAVKNHAAALVEALVRARGIENPGDVLLLLAGTRAEAASQVLTADEAQALQTFDQIDAAYIRGVKARAQALYADIAAHPNQAPAIDEGWPESPIPTTPAAPEDDL